MKKKILSEFWGQWQDKATLVADNQDGTLIIDVPEEKKVRASLVALTHQDASDKVDALYDEGRKIPSNLLKKAGFRNLEEYMLARFE
jgi:hypothetical protein